LTKRLFLLLTALVFFQGCIGAGVIGNITATIQNPLIGPEKGTLRPENGNQPWINSDELIRYWGPPDKVKMIAPGLEIWKYNFGLRWNGVGIMAVILPVPLMLPVGRNFIEFKVKDNRIIEAKTKNGWIRLGALCGYVIVPENPGWVCGVHAIRKGEEVENGWFIERDILKMPDRKGHFINATNHKLTIIILRWNQTIQEQTTLSPGQSFEALTDLTADVIVNRESSDKMYQQKLDQYLGYGWKEKYTINLDIRVYYLVTDKGIFPIPVQYRTDWDTHMDSITTH
jgi:hypothetical protein